MMEAETNELLDKLHQLRDTPARLSFDQLFALITSTLALRSACAKTRQAALLVQGNRIVSIGYNGPPSGGLNCLTKGGEESCGKDKSGSCLLGIHAEQNCLGWAARYGIITQGGTLWVTQSPCISCARLIVASDIREYIYLEPYRLAEGIDFLRRYSILIYRFKNGIRAWG